MKRQTEFDKLLYGSSFAEARDLLQSELARGKLLDPCSDPYWTRFADRLARRIEESLGTTAVVGFWKHFEEFVIKQIEPKWGRAHKGHIYFRLGLAVVPSNLSDGRQFIEKAYKEDCALEKATYRWPWAQTQSAYAVLAIIDRLDDAEFADPTDRQRFLKQLYTSFDAVIDGASLGPKLVEDALMRIAPPEALSSCLSINRELQETIDRMMPLTTVALAGTLLEALLLAELHYRRHINQLPDGKDIHKAELGPLFNEALRLSVFPTNSIRVSFQLIHMFRNRVHPGNEFRQTYKLVPRVAQTVKVFFELALVEWGDHFGEASAAREA